MRDLTISLIVKFGVGGLSWSIPNITVEASSSINNSYNSDTLKTNIISITYQWEMAEQLD